MKPGETVREIYFFSPISISQFLTPLPSGAHLSHYGLFVVPHYVLIFLGGPAEALFAVLTPVGVVFGVDGDDVALKARRVRGAVLTVLALVHLPATVGLHVLLQFILLPEAPFTPFAFKRQVLGVNGEDVPTEYKRIGGFEVTVPTLVDLLPFMGLAMLLELRGPVEAFLTHLTLVGKILGVH